MIHDDILRELALDANATSMLVSLQAGLINAELEEHPCTAEHRFLIRDHLIDSACRCLSDVSLRSSQTKVMRALEGA